MRNMYLLQGGGQSGGFVDARGQHHHGAFIKDYLQFQSQIADCFQNDGLMRMFSRNNTVPVVGAQRCVAARLLQIRETAAVLNAVF